MQAKENEQGLKRYTIITAMESYAVIID